MRLGTGATTALGVLALAGMLALSSPGVRVARAGDGDAAPAQPSRVDASSGEQAAAAQPAPRVDRSASAEQIAERIRLEMLASGEKPIVLNNRGYNYRSPRDPMRELQLIEAEAKRQQKEASSGR